MVPKMLSAEQKELRQDICSDLLQHTKNEMDMLKLVITCDETWIFTYDPKTKRQSIHWKSPNLQEQTRLHVSFEVQDHVDCFLQHQGAVMAVCVPSGQTVNQHYYIEVLTKLCE
jgi:hypothetical protein